MPPLFIFLGQYLQCVRALMYYGLAIVFNAVPFFWLHAAAGQPIISLKITFKLYFPLKGE